MRLIRAANLAPEQRANGRSILALADLDLPAADRMTMLLAQHPEQFVEDRHYHRYMSEIFYFLHDADYWIAGREHHINAGDVVVIEPGEPHGALPVGHRVDIIVCQIPKVDGDKYPWNGD